MEHGSNPLHRVLSVSMSGQQADWAMDMAEPNGGWEAVEKGEELFDQDETVGVRCLWKSPQLPVNIIRIRLEILQIVKILKNVLSFHLMAVGRAS